eukprot:TRINITY_DN75218_c0_g1_i1.p1 TRINITY_DN75218_c0_g1~~TRINITY_DN75218_c0_g1_i1.p1  ORF type:complete len:722 (-),score=110.86 TRINITY_DN75218_c0_g1_i1:22-2187(-)
MQQGLSSIDRDACTGLADPTSEVSLIPVTDESGDEHDAVLAFIGSRVDALYETTPAAKKLTRAFFNSQVAWLPKADASVGASAQTEIVASVTDSSKPPDPFQMQRRCDGRSEIMQARFVQQPTEVSVSSDVDVESSLQQPSHDGVYTSVVPLQAFSQAQDPLEKVDTLGRSPLDHCLDEGSGADGKEGQALTKEGSRDHTEAVSAVAEVATTDANILDASSSATSNMTESTDIDEMLVHSSTQAAVSTRLRFSSSSHESHAARAFRGHTTNVSQVVGIVEAVLDELDDMPEEPCMESSAHRSSGASKVAAPGKALTTHSSHPRGHEDQQSPNSASSGGVLEPSQFPEIFSVVQSDKTSRFAEFRLPASVNSKSSNSHSRSRQARTKGKTKRGRQLAVHQSRGESPFEVANLGILHSGGLDKAKASGSLRPCGRVSRETPSSETCHEDVDGGSSSHNLLYKSKTTGNSEPTQEQPRQSSVNDLEINFIQIPKESLKEFQSFARNVTDDMRREASVFNPFIQSLLLHREQLQMHRVVPGDRETASLEQMLATRSEALSLLAPVAVAGSVAGEGSPRVTPRLESQDVSQESSHNRGCILSSVCCARTPVFGSIRKYAGDESIGSGLGTRRHDEATVGDGSFHTARSRSLGCLDRSRGTAVAPFHVWRSPIPKDRRSNNCGDVFASRSAWSLHVGDGGVQPAPGQRQLLKTVSCPEETDLAIAVL